jgi:GGDEF domain-containing protein
MIRVTSELGQLVRDKTEAINDQLMHPDDGLPAVSLSVGAAFSDCEELQGDIFSAADSALYKVKNRGRCGCAIYGEDAD